MTTEDPTVRLLAEERALALREGIIQGLCKASSLIRANAPNDSTGAHYLYHNITAAIHDLIAKELATQAIAWHPV